MNVAPIDRILPLLTNVKSTGRDKWIASSPTRKDRNPSLSIAIGEEGKVILKDFGGSSVEEICDALGLTLSDLFATERQPMDTMRVRAPKKKTYATPTLPDDPTFREGAIKWFGNRGISEATMKHFGIYTDTHYFHKLNKVGPAICIPYRKDGATINIKYRSPQVKDFAMVEDAEPCFFNLDATKGESEVVICEGEADVLALFEAGVTSVVSPPNGCQSITETVMESAAHLLGDERIRIVLAGDMDEQGQKMLDDLARRIGKERCFKVLWPSGCKDANDTLLNHGAEKVRQSIEDAAPYPVEGIIYVNDVMDGVWQLYADGLPRGASTGIPSLDEHYTIKTGYWTMVIAAPGSGKSNILDQISVNLAESLDWKFAIASLENPDIQRHVANIMPKHARKPFGTGRTERMNAEDIQNAGDWMHEHFFFIQPEEPSVEEILMRAKALVFSKGIKGLILDPWNEMEHPPTGLNNGDYISRCLTMIRRFAYAHDIHIWLVVHPTKLIKDSNGQYPVPSLYDASGSALFFNKADFGLAMWRDLVDRSAPVQIHIKKSRHAEVASLGQVNLGYDPATTRYYDLDATGETSEDIATWRPQTAMERIEAGEARWEEKTYAAAD